MSEFDSLIVAIDDADIRSTQCYYVLEDLRLYIRHPRLVILMAGDKNMYIEHIREHLFLEYKNKYHKAEPIGKDARLQMVINHADQYLLKLFPLINQHELVNLQTLRSKEVRIDFYLSFQDYTKRVNGKDLPLTTQKNLRELLGRVFFLLISENEAEIEPFIETFFRLPLRSILQVLHFWSEHKVWHYLDELHNPGSHTIVTNDDRNYYRKEIIYVVKNSLKRILIEEANLKSFNYVWEYELDGHSYYTLLLHHYQHTSNLEQGCLLDGRIGRNNQTKFTTLLLAILFKSHVKTLHDFLSFILFGPATISLYTRFSTESRRQKIDSDSQEKRALFDNYMQVGCGINAAEWSRRASIILSLTKQNAGVQQVNSRIHLEYIATKLSDINTNSIPENYEQACQIFTILTLLSRTDPVENTYILSIYNYLGFIVQCLSICKTAKNSRLQIFNDLIESYFDIKYAPYPVQQLANTNKRNSINFDNFKKKKQTIRQALMALPDATDSSKLSLNTLQGLNSVNKKSLERLSELLMDYPDLRKWVRGLDSAASEEDTPPDVFAPAYRMARRVLHLPHATYHAGEDFYHIISGVRVVCEAVDMLNLMKGDRIGHATALGVDPFLWMRTMPGVVTPTRGEWLQDLIFTWDLLQGVHEHPELVQKLNIDIREQGYAVFRKSHLSPYILKRVFDLRRLDPETLLNAYEYAKVSLLNQGVKSISMEDIIDALEHSPEPIEPHEIEKQLVYEAFANESPEVLELIIRWQKHEKTWKNSEERIEVPTDYFSLSELLLIQQLAMRKLVDRAIVIETLPSSNLRISQYKEMGQHHSLRWLGVSKIEGDISPLIVLGSDDPGVFATDIKAEFYHVYASLRKRGLNSQEALEKMIKIDENGNRYAFRSLASNAVE